MTNIPRTTLAYTYDDKGLITGVSSGANSIQYRYDAFGQLIRENYNWNKTSYTAIYAYDEGGNITSKKKHAYVGGDGNVGTATETVSYGYGDSEWKDKLTSFNGKTITYDTIGNPLNDGTRAYTWTQGRRLDSVTAGTTTVNYKYNDQSIRTEKTVNGVTTQYHIADGVLTWEKTGSNTPIYYLYDADGQLWGLQYKGNVYFYVRNVQNEIMKLVDGTGTVVVTYSYDAWGKPLGIDGTLATTLGKDNPFWYKGYYYDTETGLYYLNSRYYDPNMCRFINADEQINDSSILGTNLFAYCYNNPANMADYDGTEPITLTCLGVYFLATTIVALCATHVISTPRFQRSWNELCTSIGTRLQRGLQNIGGTISKAINFISSKAKAIAKSIAASLIAAKSIPKYRSPKEWHHLVAKAAPNAGLARSILNAVGIGINSMMNLAYIKTGVHRRLHTNSYYGWANSIVISAYNAANGNKLKQKKNVIAALGTIRAFVTSMSAVSPF